MLAARAHRCYFAPGFFDVLLHPTGVSIAHPSPGLFERLVNSCALVIVPLTVLAGWSEGVGEHIHHVFWESFWVASLSACALSPLLRDGGKSCAFASQLKSWVPSVRGRSDTYPGGRFLLSNGVLRRVESALEALGVRQLREKG